MMSAPAETALRKLKATEIACGTSSRFDAGTAFRVVQRYFARP
jgi:hypothetical protein